MSPNQHCQKAPKKEQLKIKKELFHA